MALFLSSSNTDKYNPFSPLCRLRSMEYYLRQRLDPSETIPELERNIIQDGILDISEVQEIIQPSFARFPIQISDQS